MEPKTIQPLFRKLIDQKLSWSPPPVSVLSAEVCSTRRDATVNRKIPTNLPEVNGGTGLLLLENLQIERGK